MILLSEGRSESGNFEPTAIWAEHVGLARFAKDYFHYLWDDADNTGEKPSDINTNRKKNQRNIF
jgi:hypothetical protein